MPIPAELRDEDGGKDAQDVVHAVLAPVLELGVEVVVLRARQVGQHVREVVLCSDMYQYTWNS